MIQVAPRTGGKLRSLSFLEPQLLPPLSPCAPVRLMSLPLGFGSAFAASPLAPWMIARGCAPQMSRDDAAAHAYLLRIDGRGLHLSTLRLNLSAFCGIGVHSGVVEGFFGGVRRYKRVSGGVQGVL
jgi:hypothetical protein